MEEAQMCVRSIRLAQQDLCLSKNSTSWAGPQGVWRCDSACLTKFYGLRLSAIISVMRLAMFEIENNVGNNSEIKHETANLNHHTCPSVGWNWERYVRYRCSTVTCLH